MALELITIDYWNTLIDSSKGVERNEFRQNALKSEIAKLGVNLDPKEYNDAMQASWQYFNKIWDDEMRTPLPIETVEFFWNYLKLPKDKDAVYNVVKAFAECNLVYQPNLIDGVMEALTELSGKYKLGIVSDTGFSPGTTLRKLLKEKDVLHFFDAFSFSDETGVSKPHPKAYETIMDQLKIEPGNCLHIGDIEKTDIAGAKNLGMKAIRFSGNPTEYVVSVNTKETNADAEIDKWPKIVEWIKENDK